MEVNDYIRTKEFGISRIKCFDNNEPILENGFTALQKEYKSSPNIIDLIEVGDYVNGKEVAKAEDVYTTDNIYIGKGIYTKNHSLIAGQEEDIKSIVTHEQFKSMEYKVKEQII